LPTKSARILLLGVQRLAAGYDRPGVDQHDGDDAGLVGSFRSSIPDAGS
jgi:hypothetical protein